MVATISKVDSEETAQTEYRSRHLAKTVKRGMSIRWLMWSILALCYLIVYFQRIAPGVVADRLMADYAVGGAAVGFLTAIYMYAYAAMQIPAGILSDTLGVRRTVFVGASSTALGSIIFGLAPTLDLSYLGRLLVGLGVSVIFVATLKFQSTWFRASEFGTVSGLLMLIGSLGAVIATTPVALLAQWVGWRLSFVSIGAISAALALAAWLWVRDRPADLGLSGPADPIHEPRTGATGPRTHHAYPSFRAGAAVVWRNRQTWAGFLAHFGLFGAYLTLNGLWGVPYLMHVYGFDRIAAANYLLVSSLGLLVSAPLAGRLSDLMRLRRPLTVGMAGVTCCVWLALTFWNNGMPPEWALYPLFALMGLAGGNVTLILSAVKEGNPLRLSGLATGTANNAFLCAAFLQPAVGCLLDQYWQGAMHDGSRVYPLAGYHTAFMIMTAFVLLGGFGAYLLRETHCRNSFDPTP